MVHDYLDKNTFLCEMYDEDSKEVVQLILNFFPFDNSFKVIDPKRGVILLKRVQIPIIIPEMLQIGNVINVFSRFLFIKDCAPATRQTMFKNVESTFALIKPVPPNAHGKILTFIMKNGFRITRMKNGKITKDFAKELYSDKSGSEMMPMLIDYVTSGEVIGLELVAPHAVEKWRECLGETDPREAAPGTLRALYGENILKNVAHACKTRESAAKMLEAYFGSENGLPKTPYRATFKDCTCCIIKPHALIDGNMGAIIEHISSSKDFYISAMAMYSVRLIDAEEFYEIYKDVVVEYKDMSVHLAEGKCVVLEVKCKKSGQNIVTEFRKMCGPRDPDVCRQLYPDTIRALYGKDIVHNAVHCTDLPEDGVTEVEYFFKLLANEQNVESF